MIALLSAGGSRAAAGPVAVFPIPGARFAAPSSQITFRGIPASQFGAITVTGAKSGAHTGRVLSDSDGHGGSFLPTKPFAAGEKVTVTTGMNIVGGTAGTYRSTSLSPAAASRRRLRSLRRACAGTSSGSSPHPSCTRPR